MSAIKIEIKEIVSKSSNVTRFKGSYYGNHATFSPRGFEAVVEGCEDDYNEGGVYYYDPKTTEILSWGDGHEEIIRDFEKQLNNLI